MSKARELSQLADELNVDASGNASFTGDVAAASISTTGNITVGGTVDGRDIAADGTTLDGLPAAYQSYTDTAIANLVDTAPATLDTLNELAAALGDDPNFATTVTNSLAGKVDKINITGSTVGSASEVPVITFNSQGQITGATTTAVAGVSSVSYDIATGVLTINTSDGSSYPNDLGIGTSDSPTFAGATINGNITVTGTVDGRDVAADGTKLDGIESGATADQTASEILTAIKTVDGAASGLDADLLDGQQGSYYLDANNFVNMPAGYTGWTVSDGTNSESVTDGSSVTFAGSGATSVSYNTTTNTLTVSSTDTNTTYSAGGGLTLSGTTFSHTDTSAQGSVNNSNGTVIQDVTLDTYGHVTGLTSVNLDSRYATGRGIHGWGSYHGGNLYIYNSYNLSSVQYFNSGYRYNWASAVPSSNYIVSGSCKDGGDFRVVYMDGNSEYTTTQTRIYPKNRADGISTVTVLMVQVTK